MSKYSECCSAPPVGGMEEYGICGKCKEHCEFLDDEEADENLDDFDHEPDRPRICADEKLRSVTS